MVEIFLSAFISIFIGAIGFLVGVKTIKDRTDRLSTRDLYKKILVHFNESLHHIKYKNPLRWSDFKYSSSFNYIKAPVNESFKNGEINVLPDKIAHSFQECENAFLGFGDEYYSLKIEFSKKVIKYIDEIDDIDEITFKPQSGKSYRPVQLSIGGFIFQDREKISEFKIKLAEESFDCLDLFLPTGVNNTSKNYKLKKTEHKNILVDIIDKIIEISNQEFEFEKLLKRKNHAVSLLEENIKICKLRIKDPHPTMEMIRNIALFKL